ncbi:TPA: DUF3265 domain-containing protein [Vibrio vulnificus]|nr:DUF3265 domain-containing protein [Vibrio vulnificus]
MSRKTINLTRRSSGIRAAWHFWYAVGFGGKGGLLKVGLGGTHPLTQRYTAIESSIRDEQLISL